MADLLMKRCNTCMREKHVSEFNKSRRMKDGLQGKCRDCSKKDIAEYTKRNKDKINARRSEYRFANIDKISKREIAYGRLPHVKELRSGYSKERLAANPKKAAARHLLNNAIRAGNITSPGVCSLCPSTVKIEGHHEDYDKPLDVQWVCRRCHSKITKRNRAIEVKNHVQIEIVVD